MHIEHWNQYGLCRSYHFHGGIPAPDAQLLARNSFVTQRFKLGTHGKLIPRYNRRGELPDLVIVKHASTGVVAWWSVDDEISDV
jgi:hypothetical protein